MKSKKKSSNNSKPHSINLDFFDQTNMSSINTNNEDTNDYLNLSKSSSLFATEFTSISNSNGVGNCKLNIKNNGNLTTNSAFKKSNKKSLFNSNNDDEQNSNSSNEMAASADQISSISKLNSQSLLNSSLTCPVCFKLVKTSLESHFEMEHHEYECSFCGLLFDNDYILNQHMSTVHMDDMKPIGSESVSDCNANSCDTNGDLFEFKKIKPLSKNNNNNNNTMNSQSTNWEDIDRMRDMSSPTADLLLNYKAETASATSSSSTGTSAAQASTAVAGNILDDDENNGKLICPVCMLEIKDGIRMLELHVDLHFQVPCSNNNYDENDVSDNMPSGELTQVDRFKNEFNFFMNKTNNKSNLNNSRAGSTSSLLANVDENFESDQVMTLTDCLSDDDRDYYIGIIIKITIKIIIIIINN